MFAKCVPLSLSIFAFLIFIQPAKADIRLPNTIGNGMVLQQQATVNFWGWADHGEKVTVKTSWGKDASAVTASNGKWIAAVKTPKAGGPYTVTISGKNKIELDDIMIGEVWICSGQSNMEYHMSWLNTERIRKDVKESYNPKLRLYTVAKAFSATPKYDVKGQWQICKPETANEFSATAYYFGQRLQKALGVPIGLISTNWGGTVAEAWTSREGLADFEEFKFKLDFMEDPEKALKEFAAKQDNELEKWYASVAAVDPGTQQEWYETDYSDRKWKELELPQLWTNIELNEIDGSVWFRKEIELGEDWANKPATLRLAMIDDLDTTWVNGELVGTTNGWNVQRKYAIPANVLKAGKNVIAIRMVDYQGEGGLHGDKKDLYIAYEDGSKMKSLAGGWKYKASYNMRIPAFPAVSTNIDQNSPTCLYNAMIVPLLNYRIAGAIWYQGESNKDRAIQYRSLFPAMIKDWRNKWGQGDFPFYYVQIAPYKYEYAGESELLREAQLMTLSVPNTGMAVTLDIGEYGDIHPKNKHDVGDRLARWALAKDYGKDIVYSGPVYKGMKKEGDKIRLFFDYAENGLKAPRGGLRDFMICTKGGSFTPAEAKIDGNTVIVYNNNVKNPAHVRYGWRNWVMGTLFNAEGLPASSFRTDNY